MLIKSSGTDTLTKIVSNKEMSKIPPEPKTGSAGLVLVCTCWPWCQQPLALSSNYWPRISTPRPVLASAGQCFLTMYHDNCWFRIVALYLEACWCLVSISGRVMYIPTTGGILLATAFSIF